VKGSAIEDLKRKRFFKVKKAAYHFLCPLCASPRQMRYRKILGTTHYIQILLLSGALVAMLWPWMGFKATFLTFLVWMGFELVNKLLYRKEIPCPYCGFDATWYKRDVKLARKKVQEFWQMNQDSKTATSESKNKEPEIKTPKINPNVFTAKNAENVTKDTIGSKNA
jgi:hypothetical protein